MNNDLSCCETEAYRTSQHHECSRMAGLTLLHTDCMQYMATLPDEAFDLAITDPPYGIKQDGHRQNNRSKLAVSTNFHKALWGQAAPDRDYFVELERVSRNQIIWGGNHLAALIGRNSPCWIVWDKYTTGGFADCELAYTSFKTAVRKSRGPAPSPVKTWDLSSSGARLTRIITRLRVPG